MANIVLQHKTCFFSPFEWILVIGIVGFNVVYSILTHEINFIGSAAAIAGVLCVVLVAKRSIWNYLFGLINVSLYAYIAYKTRIYGDAALNAFYYLPMQFIGFFMWNKHLDNKDRVESKVMNTKQRLIYLLISIVAVLVTAQFLVRAGDPQPYKDATTTVLSIIAQFLMVRAFMEQWVLWIVVNAISLLMWIICIARGDVYAWLMVGLWSFYLANSINGLVQWNRTKNN